MKKKRIIMIKPHRSAEVSKPVVIAVIAVLAILGLSLLVYFSDVFVGKAVSFGDLDEYGVGFGAVTGDLKSDELGDFPVKVDIGNKKSSVVSFVLNYPSELVPDCNIDVSYLDALFNYGKPDDLTVKRQITCGNGKITFEYAALSDGNKYITGEKEIAEIKFTAKKVTDSAKLTFDSFNVYDLDKNGELIAVNIKSADIKITPKIPPSCNNDKKDGDETDINCGGSCPTKCADGKACIQDLDCASGLCANNVCKAKPKPDSDKDGFPDGEDNCPTDPNGGNAGSLEEGEGKVFTVADVEYDVTLSFMGFNYAKFVVNGEGTNKLEVGDSHTLSDSSKILVTSIFYQGDVHSANFQVGGQLDKDLDGTGDACDKQTCGNDEREIGEECDGLDLGNQGCISLGYDSGTLSCKDCKFDVSKCTAKQECPPGQTLCESTCKDLKADKDNCGSCNKACGAGQSCTAGQCKDVKVIKGKRISLTEIDPVNNVFSTMITADEGFTQGVMVYTVLYGAQGEQLSLKSEWIKAGVLSEKGKTYTAVVPYDSSDVKKKVVIAFDKEGPGQQVYGTLPQDYS